MTTLKTNIKSAINADQSKAWLALLKNLVVQGDLLKLARSEESDLTWRSAIYSLPRRVLSFNALIDTLPNFRNLKLWGKKMSANCKLCGNTQTLLHVLAGCKSMLEQGQYTSYIYNSILIWALTILKSGARTPRTITKFAVKTAIDLTQTI